MSIQRWHGVDIELIPCGRSSSILPGIRVLKEVLGSSKIDIQINFATDSVVPNCCIGVGKCDINIICDRLQSVW